MRYLEYGVIIKRSKRSTKFKYADGTKIRYDWFDAEHAWLEVASGCESGDEIRIKIDECIAVIYHNEISYKKGGGEIIKYSRDGDIMGRWREGQIEFEFGQGRTVIIRNDEDNELALVIDGLANFSNAHLRVYLNGDVYMNLDTMCA